MCERHKPQACFCFSLREGKGRAGSDCGDVSIWFLVIYLAKVALHEVNLADAPELLLKDVNLEREDAVGVLMQQKPFDPNKDFLSLPTVLAKRFTQKVKQQQWRLSVGTSGRFNKKTTVISHLSGYFSARWHPEKKKTH